MAVVTASGISRVAIPLLHRMLVLPRTMTMVPAEGFTGPNGETITVRVRNPRSAREQNTPGAVITYDDLNEVGVDVTLSHLYDAHRVTDEELSLELEDFALQVTEPQVASVAEGAEQRAYIVFNALPADDVFAATATVADTRGALQRMRETLSLNHVPGTDRWAACAPDIITRILDVAEFVRADALGDGPSSALREALVGRIYGMNVIEGVGLEVGTAVAYHSSGFAFATKRPADPRGVQEVNNAPGTATISAQGIAMRQIFQYVPDRLSDASVISTFAGCSAVYEDAPTNTDNRRFVRFVTDGGSS